MKLSFANCGQPRRALSIPKGYVMAGRILVIVAFLGGICAQADIAVSEVEAKKAIIKKVTPNYPPIARQMKLSGRVELTVTIDEDGGVESAKIRNGNPILGGSAVMATKQWKFSPFMAQGKASKATTVITFDFHE